jgi:hypothetical protein
MLIKIREELGAPKAPPKKPEPPKAAPPSEESPKSPDA